jgi:alanine dehydrogenase
MSEGKYSGFSNVAKQAMMQPQESMLEVKNKKNKLYIGIPKEVSFQENRIPLTPLSVALLGKQRPRGNAGKQCRAGRQFF